MAGPQKKITVKLVSVVASALVDDTGIFCGLPDPEDVTGDVSRFSFHTVDALSTSEMISRIIKESPGHFSATVAVFHESGSVCVSPNHFSPREYCYCVQKEDGIELPQEIAEMIRASTFQMAGDHDGMSALNSKLAMFMFTDKSSSEDEDDRKDDDEEPCVPVADLILQLARGELSQSSELLQPEYWRKAVNNHLTVLSSNLRHRSGKGDVDGRDVSKDFENRGFFIAPPHDSVRAEERKHAMTRAMNHLVQSGYPPSFIFMFDEVWEMVLDAYTHCAKILGEDCLLEPSFFAYALRPRAGSRVLGQNFGLPHRDYNYKDVHFADGRASLVNVWMPITEATLDNGCIYVLPREFDECFDDHDSYDHMRCALPDNSNPKITKIRFPVAGMRPLPAPAGSVLAWHGNLVHFGGACSSIAPQPRMSFTCSFRHVYAQSTHLEDNDIGTMPTLRAQDIKQVDMMTRLRLVAKSILLYKFWYDMTEDNFPKEFLESLRSSIGA